MPERYLSSWLGNLSKRISKTPSLVVTASGSYHYTQSALFLFPKRAANEPPDPASHHTRSPSPESTGRPRRKMFARRY